MATSMIWTLVVFIGAFALLGAIIYAKMTNKVSHRQMRETEQATHDLYKEGPVEDRTRGAS